MPTMRMERRETQPGRWGARGLIAAVMVAATLGSPVAARVDGRSQKTGAQAAAMPVLAKETVRSLLEEPERHVGTTVAGAAFVEEPLSNQVFWVSEGHYRLLVVAAQAQPRSAGQRVNLRGLALRPAAARERLGAGLPPSARRALAGEPIVLFVPATQRAAR